MNSRTPHFVLLLSVWSSGLLPGNSLMAEQGPPPFSLEGRDSVKQMAKFEPFLGYWERAESPPGKPLEGNHGGCSFERTNHGMTVDAACGPVDSPAEATRIFWHPIERRLVFRSYSVFNPVDLLFEGEYEFPAPETMRRTYRGYYGDGRIHIYRETWSLLESHRIEQKTERFQDSQWIQIFGGSIYELRGERAPSPES